MLIAPSIVLKIAREFLGLSQDAVEAYSGISRSSIQRAEQGRPGILNSAVELQKFYENNGIIFLAPTDGRGWGVINNNAIGDGAQLNKLPGKPPLEVRKRSRSV
ncbi:XRE family transcriptional regulator [Rhizobium leguminosarum]|uniref:helix-turn-helix domain-containing protein n=1 Tax=Rhizobium leguminosarum TaxID=384 RepID=UPI0010320FA5|nr:XRE family transcriptional regulator [Rhizobium leguminosarum]